MLGYFGVVWGVFSCSFGSPADDKVEWNDGRGLIRERGGKMVRK